MNRRAFNLLLAPVFTLTLVCSIAKLEITAPRLAKKVTSPCPFHPHMNVPSEQPAPEQAPEQEKPCYSCLTLSMLTEKHQQIHADVMAGVPLPVSEFQTVVVSTVAVAAVHAGAASPPGSPPFSTTTLRI